MDKMDSIFLFLITGQSTSFTYIRTRGVLVKESIGLSIGFIHGILVRIHDMGTLGKANQCLKYVCF